MIPKAGGGWEPLPSPTDHAALTDRNTGDPHPQYQLRTAATARYLNAGVNQTMIGQHETQASNQTTGILLDRGTGQKIKLRTMSGPGSTGYGVRVENAETNGLANVEAATPSTNTHAINPYYARYYRQPLVSGPHGSPAGWGGSGYYAVAVQAWTAMPGGALQTAPHNEPGRYRIFCCTYMTITAATGGATAHHTMYLGLLLRWEDGAGIEWRNACNISDARFTIATQHNRGYYMGFVDGWVENRPGHMITYCGAAYAEAAGATFQFGNNYRAGHEFWPYNASEAGLGGGWIQY